MNEQKGLAPVLTITFTTGTAFPSTDGFAVALSRLLAATINVILLQKLAIISRSQAGAAAGPDELILNNETGYFVRMLFGHLSTRPASPFEDWTRLTERGLMQSSGTTTRPRKRCHSCARSMETFRTVASTRPSGDTSGSSRVFTTRKQLYPGTRGTERGRRDHRDISAYWLQPIVM